MRFAATLLPAVLAAIATVNAAPLESRDITFMDDALVFDAAAFPDPAQPGQTLVGLQSFVFLRQLDLGPVFDALASALKVMGLDIGDDVATAQERVRLLGAVPLPLKTVEISVDGCSAPRFDLGRTAGWPDPGMILRNISLGTCGAAREFTATVDTDLWDNRQINGAIFNSPDSGFAVISDIDDTVKISNVLDKLALAKSTLIDDPTPVPGMPELYASLKTSLNDPQFVYVSGSPFQLYPFLRQFISDSYPQSRGPVLLQNLTLIDIPGLIDFAGSDGVQPYKVEMIDRVKGMYPNKKFLTIGDSTQRDPETYAEAFTKYGDSIACIWIRRVEGADNSEARFNAAFAGVPSNKIRVFTDAEIPSLQNIDVAGGQC